MAPGSMENVKVTMLVSDGLRFRQELYGRSEGPGMVISVKESMEHIYDQVQSSSNC